MRVVQLVTQSRGGPVDHAVDVACELAGRGYDSHVVGPLTSYAARLNAAGVATHEVSVATKTDLRGMGRLSRTIGSLHPDVLHCQDMRSGLVGRLLGRRQGVRSVVYTIHGVPDGLSDRVAGNASPARRRSRDRVYYLAGERLLAHAAPAQIVVPCAALGDYARRHLHAPAGNVHVVANGVDTDRFRPATDRSRGRATALWLGVMAPIKRVDLLVRAAAEIPDLSLLLVGSGPERARIAQLVCRLGLNDRVRMCEFADDPAPIFGAADLFVLPSAAEAMPLVLLQAMACAVPVVATNVGGVSEVVRDGVDGLLVPSGDHSALTQAVRALVADSRLRVSMGRSGRRRVVEGFTLSACVDRLVEIYRGGGG